MNYTLPKITGLKQKDLKFKTEGQAANYVTQIKNKKGKMAKVISSTLEIEAKFKLDEEDYFTFKKSII